MCDCKKELRPYTTSNQGYTQNAQIPIDRRCNGYTVLNTGNTLLIVNAVMVIQPGASIAVGGNEGEIFVGRLDIQFQLPVPAPGTPVNGAGVMQKVYLDQ